MKNTGDIGSKVQMIYGFLEGTKGILDWHHKCGCYDDRWDLTHDHSFQIGFTFEDGIYFLCKTRHCPLQGRTGNDGLSIAYWKTKNRFKFQTFEYEHDESSLFEGKKRLEELDIYFDREGRGSCEKTSCSIEYSGEDLYNLEEATEMSKKTRKFGTVKVQLNEHLEEIRKNYKKNKNFNCEEVSTLLSKIIVIIEGPLSKNLRKKVEEKERKIREFINPWSLIEKAIKKK